MSRRGRTIGLVCLALALCCSGWVAALLPGERLVIQVQQACLGFYHRYGRFPSDQTELWNELNNEQRAYLDQALSQCGGILTIDRRRVHLDLGWPFHRRGTLRPSDRPGVGERMEEHYLRARPPRTDNRS